MSTGRFEARQIGLGFGLFSGLFSGLLSFPTMVVFMLIYSFIAPDGMGSTAVLTLILPGICAIVLGVVLGGAAGTVAGLRGVQFGLRQCVLFNVTLMALVGMLVAVLDHAQGAAQFADWAVLTIGVDVFSPILAGTIGGTLVAVGSNAR